MQLRIELGLWPFEAGEQDVGTERRRVVEHAAEEGRQGVMRDDEACGQDVEVHGGLRDEERGGGSQQAKPAGEEVTQNAGDAGGGHVIHGQALMLVG